MRIPSFARRIGDRLIAHVRIPIASGENRGRRWSVASAGSGYGTGRRARQQMRAMAALIRDGDVVWDIGAHHGFVTLLAARLVGPRGVVHAFEPSERNRWFLELHLRWNRVDNVVVHDAAVGSFDGEASFGGRGSSKTYALDGGDERVTVRTAESLVRSGIAPPTFIKIDVEGAEPEVLHAALPSLPSSTRMIIAIHSREAHARCTALLADHSYHIVRSRELTAALAGGPWPGDPDLVCFGPGHERAGDLDRLRALGY